MGETYYSEKHLAVTVARSSSLSPITNIITEKSISVKAKDHAGGVPPTQIREAIAKAIMFPEPEDVDAILTLWIAEYKQLLTKIIANHPELEDEIRSLYADIS